MPRPGFEAEQHRKLFIGGLDYRTDDNGLKKFYEQWGEIVDVIVMKDPKTKRSRGFGFITYSEPEMVDLAMNNRPHLLDGREVDVKRAVPRNEIHRAESAVTVKKLFVGGLKDEVDENDLRAVFGEYGTITTISLPHDKETGRKRGFAFIGFEDYDSVDKIVLDGKEKVVKGRVVETKKALSKAELSNGPAGGGGAVAGRGARGGARGGRGAGPWGEGRGGGGGFNNFNNGNSWGGGQAGPWDSQNQWGGGGGGYGQGGFVPPQGGYGGPQGYGGAQSGYGASQGGYGGSAPGYGAPHNNGFNQQWGGGMGGGLNHPMGGGMGGGFGGGGMGNYSQSYGGGPVKSEYGPIKSEYGHQQRSQPYNPGMRGSYGR